MQNDKRRFCHVSLEGEAKVILLTVVGPNPILISNEGKFVRMLDVKQDKEHLFNINKVVHIQLEDERTDM